MPQLQTIRLDPTLLYVVRTTMQVLTTSQNAYQVQGITYMLKNAGNTLITVNNNLTIRPSEAYSPSTGAGVPVYYDELLEINFAATAYANPADTPLNRLEVVMTVNSYVQQILCNN